MKIAICYSGAIRTLSQTIENNLNFFNFADIDLYFSVWNHFGYSDKINSPDYIFAPTRDCIINETYIRNLSLNIKKVDIEQYIANNYSFELKNGLDNQGLAAQYYKINKCFNLIEDEYDAIVRLRCDMLLNNKFDKNYLEDALENDKIIFPSKIWYNHEWKNHGSINEMLWISNYKNMKKACNIYNNVEKMNDIIELGEKNYGEKICYINLEVENMTSKIQTYDFDYRILR